jgi:uncharacterized protein
MANFFRILSIDGGGIRGIIPGQILTHLEHYLQTKTGNPDARLSDFFDMIAGTSTGGILACAYLLADEQGRPKMTASEVVDIYLSRGSNIFSIPTSHSLRSLRGVRDEKYPAYGLENALKDYFGDTKLSQLLKPCLITSYDIKRRSAHFFKQHFAKEKGNSHDYLVRELARATSAAPTYFECAFVRSDTRVGYPLIDGGIIANNPAMCAYAEAVSAFGKRAKDMAILSVGTGSTSFEFEYKSVKDWGLVEWPAPLIDMMMSGVSEIVDYQLRQMFHATEAAEQYHRISPALPRDVAPEMDDTSPTNLHTLQQFGTEVYQDREKELKAFADTYLLD